MKLNKTRNVKAYQVLDVEAGTACQNNKLNTIIALLCEFIATKYIYIYIVYSNTGFVRSHKKP